VFSAGFVCLSVCLSVPLQLIACKDLIVSAMIRYVSLANSEIAMKLTELPCIKALKIT